MSVSFVLAKMVGFGLRTQRDPLPSKPIHGVGGWDLKATKITLVELERTTIVFRHDNVVPLHFDLRSFPVPEARIVSGVEWVDLGSSRSPVNLSMMRYE